MLERLMTRECQLVDLLTDRDVKQQARGRGTFAARQDFEVQ